MSSAWAAQTASTLSSNSARPLPGRLQGHSPGKAVEPEHRLAHVHERERAYPRDRAPEAAQDAAVLDHLLARAVGREGLESQLAGQREHPVLGRADPLAP